MLHALKHENVLKFFAWCGAGWEGGLKGALGPFMAPLLVLFPTERAQILRVVRAGSSSSTPFRLGRRASPLA